MEKLTVIELKQLAKEKGLKGYSKLRKAELIELLQSNIEEKEEAVKMESTKLGLNLQTFSTSEPMLYIANLGKYNEGELVGDWIKLPFTNEEIEQLFVNIQLGEFVNNEYIHGLEVDGVVYEEYAIHDYMNIPFKVGEYDNLNNINEKIELYQELEAEHDSAVIEYFFNNYEEEKALNYLLDNDYFIQVNTYENYHNYTKEDAVFDFLEETGYFIAVPESFKTYFDIERYTRDFEFEYNIIELEVQDGYAFISMSL